MCVYIYVFTKTDEYIYTIYIYISVCIYHQQDNNPPLHHPDFHGTTALLGRASSTAHSRTIQTC